MAFKDRVLNVVRKIKKGKFLTYKEVAKLAGNEKAYRAVGNILKFNEIPYDIVSLLKKDHKLISNSLLSKFVSRSSFRRDNRRKPSPGCAASGDELRETNVYIPCHRVIKNDYTVGGYFGSYKNSWIKLALLLKEGVIAIMPTDTIYGICGSALNKQTVEKIYKLRRRSPQKPMIILISDFDDLKVFGVEPNNKEMKILKKIWPGKVSVILEMKKYFKKFKYLHRGTKTLAFRLPKPKWLRNILEISGPLVAPSANWESYEPAKTISEAKKYFGKNVIYYDRRGLTRIKRGLTRKSLPSTLIKLKNGKIEIIRQGGFKIKIK